MFNYVTGSSGPYFHIWLSRISLWTMVWWRFSWLVLSIPFVGFSCKKGPIVQSGKKCFFVTDSFWQFFRQAFLSFFELFCPNHNRLTMWSFQSDRMSWRNFVHFLFFAKIWTKENVTFLFLSLKEEEKEKKITLQDFFSEFEMRRLLSFLALVQLCWIWLSRI